MNRPLTPKHGPNSLSQCIPASKLVIASILFGSLPEGLTSENKSALGSLLNSFPGPPEERKQLQLNMLCLLCVSTKNKGLKSAGKFEQFDYVSHAREIFLNKYFQLYRFRVSHFAKKGSHVSSENFKANVHWDVTRRNAYLRLRNYTTLWNSDVKWRIKTWSLHNIFSMDRFTGGGPPGMMSLGNER